MMQILARESGEGKWDIQIRKKKVKCLLVKYLIVQKIVIYPGIISICLLKFNIQIMQELFTFLYIIQQGN